MSKSAVKQTWFGPLGWAAVAILAAWIALGFVRKQFAASPEIIFTIESILPSDVPGDDSWKPMVKAFNHLQSGAPGLVYSTIFMEQKSKFQYPLPSLLVLYVTTDYLWLNRFSLACVGVTVIFSVLIFRELLARERRLAAPGRVPVSALESLLLPALMVVTFYPLVWSYRLGQAQTWLIALFTVLVWLWIKDRKTLAGVVGGVLVLVKPQFGLLLIWGLLRRKWSFCASFFIVMSAGFATSLALYGLEHHLNYLKILSELSRHGEGLVFNQSVNGLLNRFFLTANTRDFSTYHLPDYHPVVYWSTLLSTVVLIALSLFGPIRRKGGLLDLFIAVFTCTIASPVAWTHHYGVLLPAYAAIFLWSLRWPVLGRWTLPYLCVSYLLLGTFLGWFWNVSMTRLNVVQSYPLVGALMLLVFMYRMAQLGDPETELAMPAGTAREDRPSYPAGSPITARTSCAGSRG